MWQSAAKSLSYENNMRKVQRLSLEREYNLSRLEADGN